MYMPTLGRWISKDPLPEKGEPEVLYTHDYVAQRMQAVLHPYTYAENSPTGRFDPSGLQTAEDYEDAYRRREWRCISSTGHSKTFVPYYPDAPPESPWQNFPEPPRGSADNPYELKLPEPKKPCSGQCFALSKSRIINLDITKFDYEPKGVFNFDCGIIKVASKNQIVEEIKKQLGRRTPFSSDTCSNGCACKNKTAYDGKYVKLTFNQTKIKPDPSMFKAGAPSPDCRIILSGTITLNVGKGWLGECGK